MAGGGLPLLRGNETASRTPTQTLLRAGRGCGTEKRCQFQFEGQDRSRGQAVHGRALVLEVTESGALLEFGGEQYHVGSSPVSGDSSRPLSVTSGQLDLGRRLPVRELDLDLNGKSLAHVTQRLWDTMLDAPVAETTTNQLDYNTDDARLTGNIVLQNFKSAGLPRFVGLSRQGQTLTLNHVPVRVLNNLHLDKTIQSASVTVTYPAAVPEPNLEADFFDPDTF